MICVGLSDILYAGDTLGENSCIVCMNLSLLYAPMVTLYSMRMIFTLMIFIDLIRAIDVVLARDSMKIPTAIQYCEV